MKQSIIAILDILGTKGSWADGNLDVYFDAIKRTQEQLKVAKKKFNSSAGKLSMEFDFISFSDTLVITLSKTKKDNEKDSYFFHEFISPFSQIILGIFQGYFSDSLFLRGSISFGELEKRGNHFAGPAVDDAAEWFEMQDMIGINLTPKASIAMDYAIEWNKYYNNEDITSFLVKYRTPLKNSNFLDLYQINWVRHFFDEANKQQRLSAEASLKSFFSKRNIPLLVTSKYSNTIQFFKTIGQNYR